MAGRPEKLKEYTQEEVQQKILELGTIKAAGEFYGVGKSTIRKKIGDFEYRGVKREHIEEIRKMSKTHTMKMVAELLGYNWMQIDWVSKKHKIPFGGCRKPRTNSKLSHYEMHNMDLIVKQYPTQEDCAADHDVCTKTIQKHIKLSSEARKREACHSV